MVVLVSTTPWVLTRSHLQGRGVDSHCPRGEVTVTLLDGFDDSYIFDAGIPEGEGACHARRPCSDDEDSRA